ncbi:MAG: hypothetical protein H6591_07585 [Flavobacteriales bacterium]|nr:hypothetical protein [Flavobacteriales bacterium]
MTRTLFILALSVATCAAFAQQPFPAITGEFADGRVARLPAEGAKGYTIIALAFGQKAQPALEEWFEPAYLRFVEKHGLFATAYEAEVFFVPVFTGLNKAAYEPSMKRFRKSAAPGIVDRVLFVKAEFEAFKEALGLKGKDIPYFFVLDAEGRVIHREEGAFSDSKLEAIEDILLR